MIENNETKEIDLGEIDTRALIRELESRDYYVFEYDPTEEEVDLDEIDSAELYEELKSRGLIVLTKSTDQAISDYLSELANYELKDVLCDLVGVNHHTSNQELMKLLKEKIS